MKKSIILTTLVTFAVNAYSQTAFSSSKFGGTLMECFYMIKTSTMVSFPAECQESLKQKIFELDFTLQTQLKDNKAAILSKIGKDGLEELKVQLDNYQKFSTTNTAILSDDQIRSMVMWIALSKSTVENLFIKLQR